METTPMPIRATPKKRRWWRLALLLLALMVVMPIVWVGYAFFSLRGAWGDAEAEADQLDPRWRLMDIEADRANVPDNENSALHIMTVTRKAKNFAVSSAPNYERIFAKLPPTAQLNDQQVQIIRGQLATIARPLAEARKLKEMPRGRFPITYSDDYIRTSIDEQQKARRLAEWLQHDAWLLAQENQHDQALDSCWAILNAGRSSGDEPMLLTRLIRIAIQSVSARALERVLAQGQAPDPQLQSMQAALAREMQESDWLPAVRGERAGAHRLFNSDTLPIVMLKYYPDYLRYLTRSVEIAKLPIHERVSKLKELEAKFKTTGFSLIGSMSASLAKLHQAECRGQAMLRSAMVALACERYRLNHKDEAWPDSLADLLKAKLLDAIPTDPMDGQPLRYCRTKDSIVIYSIGLDMTDDQGKIDRERPEGPGVDIGFRLWDVQLRRQAPLPPVGIAEKEER